MIASFHPGSIGVMVPPALMKKSSSFPESASGGIDGLVPL
jgi:hypothetical protein